MPEAPINNISRMCSDTGGWKGKLPEQYEQSGLIEDHFSIPSKMPPIPDSYSQCHMIFLLSPYKCNRMKVQISAISQRM